MASLALIITGSFVLGGIGLACLLGLFFIYKSRKLNLYLLSVAALMIIFSGFFYLGLGVDYVSILMTGDNMDNSTGLAGIISFLWTSPAIICAMFIGAKLIIPERKWYVLSIYIVLGILFEIFLFLDPLGTFVYIYPSGPGTDFINLYFNYTSPAFFIAAFFLLSILILNGFAFLYKSFQTVGKIRRKFQILSCGFILFVIAATVEAAVPPLGIISFVFRFGMIIAAILLYFGLKTA